MRRLPVIEGLRAYLAVWVVAGHSMMNSGLITPATGLPHLLQEAGFAVCLFMIISGFVIFMLLDQRKETYVRFIVRRFFRIFPAYVVFFLAAAATIDLKLWTMRAGPPYLADQIPFYISATADYWKTMWWNLPLHLTLLQGLVPDSLVGP